MSLKDRFVSEKKEQRFHCNGAGLHCNVWSSLFQALGSWGRAKTSEEKTREDLVLPHFFSRSPFFSLPATESLEQAMSGEKK